MKDPELRISGCLRDSLQNLRAVSDDRQLCILVDAEQEHASFHTLVDTGIRGLERYLTSEEIALELREVDQGETDSSSSSSRRGDAGDGKAKTEEEDELAQRSLALIDASLDCAALTPDYQSSLAAQEGLRHLRGRIHAAVENLGESGHRRLLEKLAESLCRELSLRPASGNSSQRH